MYYQCPGLRRLGGLGRESEPWTHSSISGLSELSSSCWGALPAFANRRIHSRCSRPASLWLLSVLCRTGRDCALREMLLWQVQWDDLPKTNCILPLLCGSSCHFWCHPAAFACWAKAWRCGPGRCLAAGESNNVLCPNGGTRLSSAVAACRLHFPWRSNKRPARGLAVVQCDRHGGAY